MTCSGEDTNRPTMTMSSRRMFLIAIGLIALMLAAWIPIWLADPLEGPRKLRSIIALLTMPCGLVGLHMIDDLLRVRRQARKLEEHNVSS